MVHSCVHLYVHSVFAVKRRSPLLSPSIRPQLFVQMRDVVSRLYPSCRVLALNGVADHVHLLISIDPMTSLSSLLRDVKSRSSRFLNRKNVGPGQFLWQRGYSAFSCAYRDLPRLVRYIDRQEIHHREEDFVAEYQRILRENGIEYDDLHPDDRLI